MNEKSFHRAFHFQVFDEWNMLLKAPPETSGVFQKTSDEIKKRSDEKFRERFSGFSDCFRVFYVLFPHDSICK